MRIPAARLYRAFPELDELSDAECEVLLKRAERRRPVATVGRYAALVSVWLVASLALGLVGMSVCARMAAPDVGGGRLDNLLSVVVVQAVFIGCGLLPALLVRDAMVGRLLRREIAEAACLFCGYPLRGLPEAEGIVRCPECGKVTSAQRWSPGPGATGSTAQPAPVGVEG